MIRQVLADLACPTEAAEQKLLQFHTDLIQFNRAQNLVSRFDTERRAAALIGESCLAAAALSINQNRCILDIGSGGGLPGIPVAVWYPSATILLLERRAGRCEFLRREVRALGLHNTRVLEGDAAEPHDVRGQVDFVLLKAVAPPGQALDLARPFLKPDGRAALFREESWDPLAVADHWKLEARTPLRAPWLDRDRELFEFSKGDGT